MKPRDAVLERRRQYLSAKIAAQRSQLALELEALRGPLQAFEAAREVGEAIRRHARLFGIAAALIGFALMRGNLFSRTFRTVKLAHSTTRWWAVARMAFQLLRRWRTA